MTVESQNPAELIERSIARLEELASVLASEAQSPLPTSRAACERRLRRKEVLLSISVLLPKLRAARMDAEWPVES